MKKNKLKLNSLKLNSFKTKLNPDEAHEVKGGISYRTYSNNIYNVGGNSSKRPIWTVTEQRRDFYISGNSSGGKKQGN